MRAPLNINILPTDSDEVKMVKQKLNQHIKRLDECYRLLRADVAALSDVDVIDDHGELNGLEDDDHEQYILANGTRVYTGTGNGFKDEDDMSSNAANATASQQSIKAYVDAYWEHILNSPLGSIFYLWRDVHDNRYVQRLVPGELGEVLHTGGENQRPYWALVPGFGAEIDIRVWLDAYLYDASIIIMDKEVMIEPGGLYSYQRDNYTTDTSEAQFTNSTSNGWEFQPDMGASVTAEIITMDVTSEIDISMFIDTTNYTAVTST